MPHGSSLPQGMEMSVPELTFPFMWVYFVRWFCGFCRSYALVCLNLFVSPDSGSSIIYVHTLLHASSLYSEKDDSSLFGNVVFVKSALCLVEWKSQMRPTRSPDM